jgi:predicted DNA-binding transcriptional regulator AlpA
MSEETHADRLLGEDDMLARVPAAAAVSPRTRKRWEDTGVFPRRRHITRSMVVWSEQELTEYSRDPEGWIEKQQAKLNSIKAA